MTFRLTTLLYLFALLAASLTVFGGWGIAVAVLVFWTWSGRRSPEGWQAAARRVVWLFVIMAFFAVLLFPVVNSSRTPSLATGSMNHMKQITLAMLNYESVNGHFPPSVVTDDAGNPLYSWRVALLPYLDGKQVYDKLHLDEPWDSPHNRPLLDEFDADIFSSPRIDRTLNDKSREAHYVAIVGEQTAWPPGPGVAIRDISDGLWGTAVLVEVGGLDIHWAEPRDMTYEQALDLLTGAASHQEEVVHPGYFVSA
jgi:hypothetical protein